jgi:hypothetical protein
MMNRQNIRNTRVFRGKTPGCSNPDHPGVPNEKTRVFPYFFLWIIHLNRASDAMMRASFQKTSHAVLLWEHRLEQVWQQRYN